MHELRFATIGAGFWAQYQLAGWNELEHVRCLAVIDRDAAKAASLSRRLDVPLHGQDIGRVLERETIDFVDVVTNAESHADSIEWAIEQKLPVICQKPLTPTLALSRRLVESAKQAGVPLMVHENWRWQAPIRRLGQILRTADLGTLVRARIDYANSYPVFVNQPFLKTLDRFILTDMGTHLLDVVRFLFGEATTLYCQCRKMHDDIAGEDVATVMMEMRSGLTVTCNMSYASHWQYDRFPQTMVAVEGTRGGVSLGTDYVITTYGVGGETSERVDPPLYPWADPEYALIHSSIVECNRNLLSALRGESEAETTGQDNLLTLELVEAAYQSAAQGQSVLLPAAVAE